MPGTADWGKEPETEKGLLHTEKDGKIVKEYIPTLNGNYMEYYDGMYDAIRNNKPVPISGEDAMQVIKIIEAALKSNKEKRIVEL